MGGDPQERKQQHNSSTLVELLPEVKIKGGIMLPENSQGTVVAIGPGVRKADGSVIVPSVKVGDKVLLAEIGGTKVVLENQEYFVFKDSDLLGKFDS